MASEILNFDAVTCDYVDIVKTPAGASAPRRFHLRDDVPAEVLLGTFAMQEKLRRFREAQQQAVASAPGDAHATEAIERAWEAYDRATAHLCGEIVRHTQPEVTDDELSALFTHSELEQIIALFFARRTRASLPPPPATDDSSRQPTATVTTANRPRRRQRHRADEIRSPRR